jgi:hypothetical protein
MPRRTLANAPPRRNCVTEISFARPSGEAKLQVIE